MAVTTPPTLTAAPTSPDRSDRATFSARAIALDQWTKNSQVPQMSALGDNVYANALEAQTQATTATDKAVLTAADRVQTGLDRVQTGLDAVAAAGLDKRYLGAKSTAPTLDNQGAVLQTGAVYYDTTLAKVRTWTGSAWVEGISAVAGVTSVNGASGDVIIPFLPDFLLMNAGVI